MGARRVSEIAVGRVGSAVCAALLLACGSQPAPPSHPGPLGLETIPDDESKAIAETAVILEGFIRKTYPPGVRPAKRDAHAKAHGCVRASFAVRDVPERLRVGLFAEAKTFDAWIRYSNGNDIPQPDKVGDGRGMAIKVMGVPGKKLLQDEIDAQTQDFVMINHPVFFIDTAANYLTFNRDSAGGDVIEYFIGVRNPRDWHLRGAKIANDIRKQKVVNPLETRYWSMSPYLFGDRAVKWSAVPCEIHHGEYEATDSPNFLADNMQRNLATGEGCFQFMVQFQTHPDKMPVEDPMVQWSERDSPFIPLADIRIPSQEFRSDEQMAFCENLSMTPWHALPEHRPLGGINRLRKVVYETISRLRHELNDARRQEPTAAGPLPFRP